MVIDDHRDAAEIATEAGRLLLELRERGLPPAELKAEGDARSQAFIAEALGSRHPNDAVLSEEAADDAARLTSPGVDRRSAGRHPRVQRGAAFRLGGARRAAGRRRTGRGSGCAAGAGDHVVDGRAAHAAGGDRCAASPAGEPDATDRARDGAGRGSRRRVGADGIGRCEGGGRGPWRGRRVRPHRGPVRVGFGGAGGGGREPPGCTRRASTARRCGTTSRTRGCPICWCAGPIWPRPCSGRSRSWSDDEGGRWAICSAWRRRASTSCARRWPSRSGR